MRSLIKSILAFCAVGVTSAACNKQETPATPTDVVLHVPGMY